MLHMVMKCMLSSPHPCDIYHTFNYIITNRFLVFNRIFEKEMIKDIRETWSEMVPKIFDVTKHESNAKLRSLYEESITCTSEGMVI